MLDDTNILLYLDDYLVKGIASLFSEGYIEVQSIKRIVDLSLASRVRCTERGLNFYEDRGIKNKKEGFKDISKTDVFNFTSGKERENTFENRGCQRIEEENKKIYTSFVLHRKVIYNLINRNSLAKLDGSNSLINYKNGDYVYCSGSITAESNLVYIQNIISIIKMIGYEKLNTLIPKDSIISFDTILRIFTDIYDKLSVDNTFDIITNCSGKDLVFTVNNNYFTNQNTNKFDELNCNCNFIAKVVNNCCKSKGSIDLLRKTGNQEFYENMINICNPIINNISKLGIKIPPSPRFKIENDSIQLIPISIYI